ncbi:hypothetical protein CALCODRAFT_509440 [Calocera cornea HHB12733]|uniref:Uncharacterized protein n=1 Tax=Calocera cornea HHB12733 TaxID=1353952 RepID=A0A165FAB4_9BASI|nr:hypothetical protein CALCODRAFT_509440 [Calocera cornea HHB12733]
MHATGRVSQLFSLGLTTLPPVFDIVANSTETQSFVLDIAAPHEDRCRYMNTVEIPRDASLTKRRLVLHSSMLHNAHLEGLFQSWPKLWVFSLESDPNDVTPIGIEGPDGFGRELNSLWTICRCCPDLYEPSLPYVDTSVIPKVLEDALPSVRPFELYLSHCHTHDQKEVRDFIQSISSEAESSFEECLCDERVHDSRAGQDDTFIQ